MKKLILIVLTLFFTNYSYCGEKQIVDVNIKRLKDSEIVVKIYNIPRRKVLLDTIIGCNNGRFRLNKQFSEPVYAIFTPRSGMMDTKNARKVVNREAMTIELYIVENEKYRVSGSLNGNSISYSVSGSEINSITSGLKNKYIQAYIFKDLEREYFKNGRSKIERDSVYALGENILKKMALEKFEYVKANLNNSLSGLFLSEQSNKIFDEYYDKLGEEVRNGLFKYQIDKKKRSADLAATRKKIVAGTDAIDFTLKDLDGNSITLSSLKGKYVLLYFWGSW